jgi:hypothetical protein
VRNGSGVGLDRELSDDHDQDRSDQGLRRNDGSWTVRWEAGDLLGTDSWIEEGGKWRSVVTEEVAALDSC